MATRLPSGSYRTQVLIGRDASGKRLYKSFTAATAKQADLLALQWQADHPSDTALGDTLRKAMRDFLRTREAVLSPSTIRGYNSISKELEKGFPRLVARKIALISGDDLQQIVNQITRTRSPKTARNYYGFLRSVYRYKGLTIPFAPCPESSTLC